jgi:hypothetical protein
MSPGSATLEAAEMVKNGESALPVFESLPVLAT